MKGSKPFRCTIETGIVQSYANPAQKIKYGPYFRRGPDRKSVVDALKAELAGKLEVDGRQISKVVAVAIPEDIFNMEMLKQKKANLLPGFTPATGKATKRQTPVTTWRKKNGDRDAGT
jgi:hypothetical protein